MYLIRSPMQLTLVTKSSDIVAILAANKVSHKLGNELLGRLRVKND